MKETTVTNRGAIKRMDVRAERLRKMYIDALVDYVCGTPQLVEKPFREQGMFYVRGFGSIGKN